MRQMHIGRRRTGPASWQQTPLPLDARDADIVHAHQITRPAELGRRDLRARRDHCTEEAAQPAADRPRKTPCIQ
jgi:hypothetical protein